ncbi:acyltransferase [Cryobacterium sp. TMT2-15-1]|uniref:acyltransferase n=1 Tax=Cryobacterium sp. TMT2-15-1 TaxID=1259246 RepID=UPI00106CCB76|nr:acyltransferase [Cryobacterium sp. TMT2-15-1]TFC63502.1 acyltransferase [Cryobacterium sp. TMT2-15-1]
MLISSTPNHAVQVIARLATAIFDGGARARRVARGYATQGKFASHGLNFNFDPDGTYSYDTIHVGDNVNLGTRPTLLATRSTIRLGNNVTFGPTVTIRGGNHRFDIVGVPINAVTDSMKRPEDDLGVVIEDDVWVGGGATILHGVTIGRGSVIGGGAVVTKNIPPYSIAVGNPARVVCDRFEAEDIRTHEDILYPLG